MALLLTLVVLDLWSFGYRWNPTLPASSLYPETPLVTELLKHQKLVEQREVEPFRIGGTGSAFFPNASGIFGLEDIRAHDPMTNARTIGMLRVFAGYSSDNYFGLMGTYEHPFIDYTNVRFLISSPTEDYSGERFQMVYDGKDGRIFENRKALPRFFAPRKLVIDPDENTRFRRIMENSDWRETAIMGPMTARLDPAAYADVTTPVPPDEGVAGVRTLKGRPNKLWVYVNAPRWTLVVSSQPFWPGWKIHRDGKELEMLEVNGGFIGFVVPPGKSSVRLAYKPLMFRAGVWLSLSTIAGIAAFPWVQKRRRLRAGGAAEFPSA